MWDRRDAWLGAGLGAASGVLYALVPFVGQRQWDALMTASVLSRPERVSLREVLYFAHPLVIPLTLPFRALTPDPLWAAALRECFCGAVVVAIAYLLARAITGTRVAGIIAALALTLLHERWRLATGGEEKEAALAFGGVFLTLYLDHRGALAHGWTFWRTRSAGVRRMTLGWLWALACAVHLVNFTLLGALVGSVLVAKGARRMALRDAGIVASWAAVPGVPFFVGCAVALGRARDVASVVRYHLEYHLSGEFTGAGLSPWAHTLAAFEGGRTFVLGPMDTPAGGWQLALVALVTVALVARAHKHAPEASGIVLAWLAVIAAHFYFYQPWDPEAWGPSALAWVVLIVTGSLAGVRWARAPVALGVAGLCALAALDARSLIEGRRQAASLRARTGGHASAPIADVVRWIDARIPRDALLVVDERLLASYVQIYTHREPVVRHYVGESAASLRTRWRLSSLSLRFYAPAIDRAELARAQREGRCYLLTYDPSDALDGAVDFDWEGLRFGRWNAGQSNDPGP